MSVYQSDTFEYEGHTYVCEWHYDQHMGPPWKECDDLGVVHNFNKGNEYNKSNEYKPPGYRLFGSEKHYAYDVPATIKRARKDHWYEVGIDTFMHLTAKLRRRPTNKQIIAHLIEENFNRYVAWCDDGWYWCGLVVYSNSVPEREINDSLWGIESDSDDYFAEVQQDLARNIHTRVIAYLLTGDDPEGIADAA